MKAIKKTQKNRGVALVLTSFIIGLLVLAGPVQGFNLGLSMDNNRVDKGDLVVFNVEMDISSNEGLPVEYLILELNGPEYLECKFDVEGKIISGCKGMTIVANNNYNYGYGYGYGYSNKAYYFGYGYGYSNGKLSYTITLDTSDYKTGFYNTEFIVKIGNENFSKQGEDLKINYVYTNSDNGNSGSEGCRTEWRCSEWTACSIGGFQTRVCEKVRPACYAGDEPEVVRDCILEENTNNGNNPSESGGQINAGSESSGITGAVTGGDSEFSSVKWLRSTAIILVIIAVLGVGILTLRRIRTKKASKYF